jgi:hypothetical protein
MKEAAFTQTGRTPMKTRYMLTPSIIAVLGLVLADPATVSFAQEKQKISYKTSAANSKFTQRHILDVGDVKGHTVRVYELYRSYPDYAPVVNGLKFKESWQEGYGDYIDDNGAATYYTVTTMENGDKFFTRGSMFAQSSGTGKLTTTSIAAITGGTGKLAGINGTIRSVAQTDVKAGSNEALIEMEYWMEK